jgi:hypothetical protein
LEMAKKYWWLDYPNICNIEMGSIRIT